MNVQTLIVSPREAEQKLDQYKRLLNSQRQAAESRPLGRDSLCRSAASLVSAVPARPFGLY